MPNNPPKCSQWSGWTLAALLLPALYIGAYYSLLTEGTFYGEVEVVAIYSLTEDIQLGDWAETFFHPMNWLDRRLRPEVWKPLSTPVGG